ncbi:flagellar brake protein [Heyndrickxia sp. NPDC080065]|uniref:flagellar brake protein n=1 Tax=Heyndrickxia sp. NPDC080065 TaxID=3390568 RepID=UPI003CFF8233
MLNIGMMLTLETLENENVEKYKCKIADIDGDKLYIDYPISIITNRTAFLTNSLEINVMFSTEDNLAFQFRSKVIGKIKKKIPLIVLQLPPKEDFKKIQRRQFVRVETALDISIHFPNSNYQFATVTEDISAGGCAIILPKNIAPLPYETGEALLVLPMQSGEYHYIKTTCKLIRIWDVSKKMVASIEFTDIQEKEKQQIFRFCFEKQLELRKKGLLN